TSYISFPYTTLFRSADQLIGPRPYGLRLDTLIRLRWLAVAGQAFTLVVVHWVLGIPLQIWPALAVVGMTAFTNIPLRARKPRPRSEEHTTELQSREK